MTNIEETNIGAYLVAWWAQRVQSQRVESSYRPSLLLLGALSKHEAEQFWDWSKVYMKVNERAKKV